MPDLSDGGREGVRGGGMDRWGQRCSARVPGIIESGEGKREEKEALKREGEREGGRKRKREKERKREREKEREKESEGGREGGRAGGRAGRTLSCTRHASGPPSPGRVWRLPRPYGQLPWQNG